MRMNKIGITVCELMDIIDENIENSVNIHIICNEEIVDIVEEYLYDKHDLVDMFDCEEELDFEEYYIGIFKDRDNELNVIIESARNENGDYDTCEYCGETECYVFSDMTYDELDKSILGAEVTSMFCELVECDECECENECEDCDDEIDPEIEYLAEKTIELLEGDFCPNCAFDFVMEIFKCGYDLGFEDCRLNTIGYLESEDDEE